jgi:hypothetical protein
MVYMDVNLCYNRSIKWKPIGKNMKIYTIVAVSYFGGEDATVRTATFDNFDEAKEVANKWAADEIDIHISELGSSTHATVSIF